ncbi:MAG: beta-N-acetylhexosaminidase [Rhodospirillales bacterium]|nr:beta-N-acetylhexosaminidase [Rhodospirillales bacterium]
MTRRHPLAAIFGCAGTALSPDEFRFIRESDPLGFIIFARNISTPDATKALVASFREAVGRADAPVLIDQEGGRVARLRPPHWRKSPPARAFVERAAVRGQAAAIAAVRTNFRLIAAELSELGVDVDCAPVADVPIPGSHDVIGDRAYGADPAMIAAYGRAVADGLLDGGVIPVVKHMPGHGRARSDSHHELPTVDASRAELERTDFAPFKALADLPWAMTAHVKFLAIDPERPATTSAYLIENVIRRHIGFGGLLLSDDLSMQALAGTMAERTRACLFAGCDVVLHCNGDFAEMEQVALSARPLDDDGAERVAAGVRMRNSRANAGFDVARAEAELSEFLVG